jgi:hypothetical protein
MATLKKLKTDYEFWSGAYADVACNADLKGIDRLNDHAEASRALAVDAFNAYLDELKNQEKIKKTREALEQVMETIAPTETPFFAKPKPLTKEQS